MKGQQLSPYEGTDHVVHKTTLSEALVEEQGLCKDPHYGRAWKMCPPRRFGSDLSSSSRPHLYRQLTTDHLALLKDLYWQEQPMCMCQQLQLPAFSFSSIATAQPPVASSSWALSLLFTNVTASASNAVVLADIGAFPAEAAAIGAFIAAILFLIHDHPTAVMDGSARCAVPSTPYSQRQHVVDQHVSSALFDAGAAMS
eukprot:1160178-Pelagomonas_calceolata.AAC.12